MVAAAIVVHNICVEFRDKLLAEEEMHDPQRFCLPSHHDSAQGVAHGEHGDHHDGAVLRDRLRTLANERNADLRRSMTEVDTEMLEMEPDYDDFNSDSDNEMT